MARDKTNFTDEVIEAFKYSASRPGALTAMMNYYRSMLWAPPAPEAIGVPTLEMPTLIIWVR